MAFYFPLPACMHICHHYLKIDMRQCCRPETLTRELYDAAKKLEYEKLEYMKQNLVHR